MDTLVRKFLTGSVVLACLLIGYCTWQGGYFERLETKRQRWYDINIENVERIELEVQGKSYRITDREIISFFIVSIQKEYTRGDGKDSKLGAICTIVVVPKNGRSLEGYMYLSYPNYSLSLLISSGWDETYISGQFTQPFSEKVGEFLARVGLLEKEMRSEVE